MNTVRATHHPSAKPCRQLLGALLLLALGGLPAIAGEPFAQPLDPPPGAVGYDVESGQWLYDTDGDTFPDLTEELAGTDAGDAESNPLALLEKAAAEGTEGVAAEPGKVGFQQATCRAGFWIPRGTPGSLARLCISDHVQDRANLTQAVASCRAKYSRLCSYEDLGFLYLSSTADANYDPSGGKWLGDWVYDDQVNCGNWSVTFNNDPNMWNFEGTCDKKEQHTYWCCHDRT
jgi:hypothetical protein